MSLALDPRVRAATWRYARRFAPGDRWDRFQDGMLSILEGERSGRVTDAPAAINSAKTRQFNVARSERRDRARTARYAGLRRAERPDRPEGERIDVPTYLGTLIRREQEAVILKLWRDLEHTEVAIALGCSRMAAQLRYQRGIARLRRLYNG